MNIVKKDATISNTDDTFPGSFEVILSAPTKDRDGDTLLPEDWKMPLPDHITFDMDHAMTVAGTVGSGVPSINAVGQLMVAGTYSSLPRAQEVRTLVNEGHIKTTSVAFMSEPAEMKDGKQRRVRELLNGAFVAIPSNREALVLASKAANVIPKTGARNAKADTAHIQAIHDHAVALGATADANDSPAAAKAAAERAARKSIVGSLEATRDRVTDCLEDTYSANQYPYVRGVIESGRGGIVVFDLYNTMTGERETYRQAYTDDGAVAILTGQAEEVDVMEIVVPDADAYREDGATIQVASAIEARSLLAGVDLTNLPDAVRKALGLLVPPLETSSTDEVKAARPADIAPVPQGSRAKEAETTAVNDAAALSLRAAQFRAYRNLTAPERG